MKIRKYLFLGFILLSVLGFVVFLLFKTACHIGQEIDNFNGVAVYYNGKIGNVTGRTVTSDGYNIGLKYQCVEFVKRYYYEYLNHKMPDSYGHAKDFFDKSLQDGFKNKKRSLIQYTNPAKVKPEVNDLVVFEGTGSNEYGHVAIICSVSEDEIEIIQQNPGPFGKSRRSIALRNIDGKWKIDNISLLGWLRKEN